MLRCNKILSLEKTLTTEWISYLKNLSDDILYPISISDFKKIISNAKMQKTIDTKPQELEKGLAFFEANRENFTQLYHVWLSLFAVKSMFAEKMSKIKAMDTFKIMPDGSIEVRDPEGFVAVDHIGNAVKIVDRLVFSAENFQK